MIQDESPEDLARMLVSGDMNQFNPAAKALKRLGREALAAFPIAWDLLLEIPAEDTITVSRICGVLRALIDPENAADSFILLANRNDDDSIAKALRGLEILHESSVLAEPQASEVFRLVADSYAHPCEEVRRAACTCLRNWDDLHLDSAVSMLCEMLRDDSEEIQMDAARGLNSYGHRARDAVPSILDSIDPNDNGLVNYCKAQEAVLMDGKLFELAERFRRKYADELGEEGRYEEMMDELEQIADQKGLGTAHALLLLTKNPRFAW